MWNNIEGGRQEQFWPTSNIYSLYQQNQIGTEQRGEWKRTAREAPVLGTAPPIKQEDGNDEPTWCAGMPVLAKM